MFEEIINNSDYLTYSEISSIWRSLFSVFAHIFFNLAKHLKLIGENVVNYLYILDTCDVMYNWSISLLTLDNLFEPSLSGIYYSGIMQNLISPVSFV